MNKMQEFFNSKAESWDSRASIKSRDFYQTFVRENLCLKKGMRVLDLACGTGIITNEIYEITQSEVIGMDISDKMIEIANKKNTNRNIRYIAEDFYQTNEKGFDAVIVHNAYPHFIDRVSFKNKCLEVLNENGLLIICHSNPRNVINEKHKNMDKDLFSEILDPIEEAKFYLDRFKLIKTRQDNLYVLALEKL